MIAIVMSPPARRRRLLTARVVFLVALMWAVSSWTLILKSLPPPQQNREGARSLIEAANANDAYHFPEKDLFAPTASFIYPLHATKGTHHAYLYIGSPPQRQTLIVDTGSRLTAFPCQPHCPDCGKHASDQFHLDMSSSHEVIPCSSCLLSNTNVLDVLNDGLGGLRGSIQSPNSCYNNKCEIEQSYTEGSSWRAFEVKDKVWLGIEDKKSSAQEHKSHAVPFVFGCQVSEEGLFKEQTQMVSWDFRCIHKHLLERSISTILFRMNHFHCVSTKEVVIWHLVELFRIICHRCNLHLLQIRILGTTQ